MGVWKWVWGLGYFWALMGVMVLVPFVSVAAGTAADRGDLVDEAAIYVSLDSTAGNVSTVGSTRAQMVTFHARTAGAVDRTTLAAAYEISGDLISVSSTHGCAVRNDHAIACWGDDTHGQATPPDGEFAAVAVGDSYSCALRTDGTAACWGDSAHGRTDAPEGTYTDLAAGLEHPCAIHTDGTIRCWGRSLLKYPTDSGYQSSDRPPSGTFTDISLLGDLGCGVRTDQSVVCWGKLWLLGAVPAGSFVAVDTGLQHACALRSDRTVACWGSGEANVTDAPDGEFLSVVTGRRHSCALKPDQTLTCWGDQDDPQAARVRSYGLTDAPDGIFRAVAATSWRSCALRFDNTHTCWGQDTPLDSDESTGVEPPPGGSPAVEDIPSNGGASVSVHAASIEQLAAEGVFDGTGCEKGGFCPGEPLERWVMAVWLVRILDGRNPEPGQSSRFVDVETGVWWESYVERLAELEVTAGCSTAPARYCPSEFVTRAQMAAFFKRAYSLAYARSWGFVDTGGNRHETSIDALYAAGITAGCATGPLRYCPNKPVTRAQMATFLVRAQSAVGEPPGAPRNVRVDWVEGETLTVYWQAPSDGGDVDYYAVDFIAPGYWFPPVDSRTLDSHTARRMHEYIERKVQSTANKNLHHDGHGNYQYVLHVDEQDRSNEAGVRVVAVNDFGFVASTGADIPTQASSDHDAMRASIQSLVSEYGTRVSWLTEVWNYIMKQEQSIDPEGGGFRSEGFTFERAPSPSDPDSLGYAAVFADCDYKDLTIHIYGDQHCITEGWGIGVDEGWPPPLEHEGGPSFSKTAVHELAHVYTMAVGASSNPAAVAAGHLYVQEEMMSSGIWMAGLISSWRCVELEVYAELGKALVEEQWFGRPLASLSVSYGLGCGIPLTDEAEEVVRSSYGGRVPQWFYDTYQRSDGTYDLDGLWADVSLLSSRTLLNYVVHSLADMFGGYCPEAMGGGNPWRDGGCSGNQPDRLTAVTLTIESDLLPQSGCSSDPCQALSVVLDAPAGFYDIECWQSGSNRPWFSARWHWPAFPQWSENPCELGGYSGDQVVWVVVRADSGKSVKSNEVVPRESTVPLTEQFLSVAAGWGLSCGIKNDHSIECWGGDVDSHDRPPSGAFHQVSIGASESCGIRADGTLQCWGFSDFLNKQKPTGKFRKVALPQAAYQGAEHACAIRVDGSVECWGNNGCSRSKTVHCGGDEWGQSKAPSGTFIDVSTAYGRSCGLRSDSTITCWGQSIYNDPYQSDVAATPSGRFRAMSTTDRYSCGIRTDQTITCWGWNHKDAHKAPTGAFIDLSVGLEHACGIRIDHTIACWGSNGANQLESPAGRYTALSAGEWHTCALRDNGSVECWGHNFVGESDVPS